MQLSPDMASVAFLENSPVLEKGSNSGLITYKNNILYGFEGGILRYDAVKERFLKDSTLSPMIAGNQYLSGKMVVTDNGNRLWTFSKENIQFVQNEKISGTPVTTQIAYNNILRKTKAGYENIHQIGKTTYLMGTTEGYVIIDLSKIKNHTTHSVRINNIYIKVANKITRTGIYSEGKFHASQKNINFEFSTPYFDNTQEIFYRHILNNGKDGYWSDWNSTATASFENLSFGDYTFSVQSKIGGQISENTAVYHFIIDRPLFLTNTALILYLISLIIIAIAIHKLYKRHYSKQQNRLIVEAKNKLEIKLLENDKKFTKFINERLQQDIISKNKELASITMGMVKKNELLNNIKKEIKKFKNESAVKSVIKIIDSSLNDKDDWNIFEEALKNFDQGLVKRLKQMHSTLTHDELKLCVYLRLNLNTKEIAPLLNISPKSVEMKRYRLRKKLNLGHDDNLYDYIINF